MTPGFGVELYIARSFGTYKKGLVLLRNQQNRHSQPREKAIERKKEEKENYKKTTTGHYNVSNIFNKTFKD